MFRVKFDEVNRVWSSDADARLAFNPTVSVANILLKSMEVHGSKIAQISDDTGEQFTFQELRLKTIRAAQNLQKQSFNSKQMIGIIAGNVAHLAPVVFASVCLGGPINVLHTAMDRLDFLLKFQLTQPSLIFCEVEVYALVAECLKELGIKAKIFTFNGTKGDSEAVENLFEKTGTEEDFIPVEVDGINDTAFIMSTSGSTGPSKGVCVSHATLISEFETNVQIFANGIMFNPSPIYWITGLHSIFMHVIGGSTRITTSEPFSVELQLRLIKDYKVTIVENQSYFILLMVRSGLLVKSHLSTVKSVSYGGLGIPYTVVQEFDSYLSNGHALHGYGLTEVGNFISTDYPNSSGKESAGRLMTGFSFKIIDDKGQRCGIKQNGEIYIKSRHRFLGYYKNVGLTEKAVDSEGFFKTGDIGHIDESCHLYVVDRKKNVIPQRDEWVFPSRVEAVLLESTQIRSVCVVGIPFDEIFELPAAVVVRETDSQITEGDIYKMVEDHLPAYCKLDGGVYFVDSIGVTASGKPLRRETKEVATKLHEAKWKQNSGN